MSFQDEKVKRLEKLVILVDHINQSTGRAARWKEVVNSMVVQWGLSPQKAEEYIEVLVQVKRLVATADGLWSPVSIDAMATGKPQVEVP